MLKPPEKVEKAYELARKALGRAHAPYSQLHVASVLAFKDQPEQVVGVNVENASFGGTICAERSAVVSAISQYGTQAEFDFIVVISNHPGEAISPCGFCLQVLSEFVEPSFKIYLGDEKHLTRELSLSQLLPMTFTKKDFKSK